MRIARDVGLAKKNLLVRAGRETVRNHNNMYPAGASRRFTGNPAGPSAIPQVAGRFASERVRLRLHHAR